MALLHLGELSSFTCRYMLMIPGRWFFSFTLIWLEVIKLSSLHPFHPTATAALHLPAPPLGQLTITGKLQWMYWSLNHQSTCSRNSSLSEMSLWAGWLTDWLNKVTTFFIQSYTNQLQNTLNNLITHDTHAALACKCCLLLLVQLHLVLLHRAASQITVEYNDNWHQIKMDRGQMQMLLPPTREHM